MKKKNFISIIWGYSEGMHDMDPSENYHIQILKVAKKMGYKPIVLIQNSENLTKDPNFDTDIEVLEHRNFFSYLYLIIKFSIKNSIFYVNSHEIKSYIVPFISRRTIFMGHTHTKRSTRTRQMTQNVILKLFKLIRLNNITEFMHLLSEGINPKKLLVVPLSVATNIFYDLKQDNRKDLVYFGNITHKKNVLTILKAFEKISEINSEVKFHVVGDVLDSDFETYLNSSNVRDRVIMYGRLKYEQGLNKILNSCLVYINSSYDERQCVAVYDAALSGCALCLPNIMSFIDVFKDCALFHTNTDHIQLAKNILVYINNPALVITHTQIAQEMIKLNYNSDIIERKISEMIRQADND